MNKAMTLQSHIQAISTVRRNTNWRTQDYQGTSEIEEQLNLDPDSNLSSEHQGSDMIQEQAYKMHGPNIKGASVSIQLIGTCDKSNKGPV